MGIIVNHSIRENIIKRDVHASKFIPYAAHWNSNTLITDQDWLLKVIKLDGYAFETADDEDVDINKSILNQLFKSLSSGSFGIYLHTIRRRQNKFSDNFFDKKVGNYFGDYLREKWRKKHESRSYFVNELYITVIRKLDTKGVAFVNYIVKKIKQKASQKAWELDMKVAYEELEEATTRVTTSLRNYNTKILGIKKTNTGIFSEMLGFFSKIINCGLVEGNILVPTTSIAEYLPMVRTYFGNKVIEIDATTGTHYAGIVSLKEYGQETSAGLLDMFLQIPYELIITQTFQFIHRQVAITKMQLQQNRMIQAADKAISQIAEITSALDDAMSGRIAFGLHHLTILCTERTLKGLDGALSIIDAELANTGAYSVREKVNLEPAFWAQLPCNFDYIVRKSIISTLNLAGFASQHNYPLGQKYNNHWGDAVTVFDTTSGTPFYFNFHLRDVGHTTIIGPTGAGKTVLMNFLCAQSIKFRPRIFFFDKDRGAEIFIRALGGIYTVIEARTVSHLNPLQMDDTPDNRTFISEWFRTLVTTLDSNISSESVSRINDAVNGNFKLHKKDRILRNLVPFLGLGGPDTLADKISMWHGSGSHAGLFDNIDDRLDFTTSSVFGFEMGHLLKDKAALSPILLYLFHRISISLDGTPTMIVLDEAWALIDNPVFAPKIKDWLKVLRKLNTFVIFATQSVEDASKSSISDTLIQQTATQIFLPNLKATAVYRTVFMLSQREYTLIKSTDPSTRFFLIKQGISAVVARINLSGMDDIINVLSGRAESVLLLKEIIEEVGDNPKIWLPIFYERVKLL